MTKPDFDKLAHEITTFLDGSLMSDQRKREWLAAKIGQVYHQGAADGLDMAGEAVNEAFAKQRGRA